MSKAIKLGTVLPFTGPPALRINGPQIQAGAAAWLTLYNERGGWRGQPVELLVEDSAYDIERTAAALRKLVEQDGVVALLNANGTPQLTAALPYLEARRTPLLLPFGGADAWFRPPRWGVFGVQPPFAGCGRLLGRWAARVGHARVTVFHPHYPEISPLMAEQSRVGFTETAGPGQSVEMVCVQLGCDDGEAMAEAVLAQRPDAIIVLTNWVELFAMLRALRQRVAAPQLYSWSANVTQQIAGLGGDLLEGAVGYASLIASPNAQTPQAEEYRQAMRRHFPDVAPDFLPMTAFAHAKVFTAALDRIEEVTADALVAAFNALERCETGLLPPVGFTAAEHMGIRHVQPMRLSAGLWSAVGELEALPDIDN